MVTLLARNIDGFQDIFIIINILTIRVFGSLSYYYLLMLQSNDDKELGNNNLIPIPIIVFLKIETIRMIPR